MIRRLLPLVAATFAIGTDGYVVAGVLPDIAGTFDVDVAVAGQLVTVYALAYAVLSPLVAIATATWTRNRLLLGGLGLFVVANVLTALAPVLWVALVTRALAGLGGAVVTPACSVAAAAVAPPERRGFALSLVIGGIAIATAFGLPLGTALGSVAGWRSTMWFVAALGVLAAVGIGLFLRRVDAPPAVGLRRRLAPAADPRVAWTLLATAVFFVGNYVMITYSSQIFARATGGSGLVLALLQLVTGVLGAVGSVGSGSLTDRLGTRRVLVAVGLVATVDFALTPITGAMLGTAVLAVAIWGLAGFSIVVPQQHRLVAAAPAAAQLVISLNASVMFAGAALAGVVGGVSLDLFGAPELGIVAGACMAVGVLLAEVAHRVSARDGSGRVS